MPQVTTRNSYFQFFTLGNINVTVTWNREVEWWWRHYAWSSAHTWWRLRHWWCSPSWWRLSPVISVCTLVMNREWLAVFSWNVFMDVMLFEANTNLHFIFRYLVIPMWQMPKICCLCNVNVTDAEVARWDNDDAITRYHLSMRDDVMAPEEIIGLHEIILSC
jgi:hypothetical protein